MDITKIKPELFGFHCWDENGIRKGISTLRYMTVREGKVCMDLKNGTYERSQRLKRGDKHTLEVIRKIIIDEQSIGKNELLDEMKKYTERMEVYLGDHLNMARDRSVSCIEDVGFITGRFTLREIKPGQIYDAYLIDGNIYCNVVRYHGDVKPMEGPILWGHVFQDLMYSNNPSKLPVSGEKNPDEKFCCIYELKLEKNTILFHGHLDGVMPITSQEYDRLSNTDDDDLVLEALKNMQHTQMKLSLNRLESPTLKSDYFLELWLQCYLSKADNVTFGFRDRNAIVYEVRTVPVSQIEKYANSGNENCSTVCARRLDTFFTHVKHGFMEKLKNICMDKYDNDIRNLPIIRIVFSFDRIYPAAQYDTSAEGYKAPSISMLYLYMKLKNKTMKEAIDEMIVNRECDEEFRKLIINP